MNIQLRPRNAGPSLSATFALTFYVFSFGVLALYLYFQSRNLTYSLGAVAVACLGILFFLALWPLPVPVVIINDEGIFDRRLGMGVIRWADIVDVQVEAGAQFLCLRVRDPNLYISRLQGQAREKMQFHQSLGFMMLNIGIRGLDANLLALRELVYQKIKPN
jgi:hypothetical protein